MPELLARIRANLRRAPLSPREGPNVITFDGIQVDLDSHHVLIQGRDVRLTPKQFEVLNYLMANPNVSVPHAKILQTIWGPDYGDEVEYLHVVVNQLRKKIEPDPSKPRYILTEPWLGYRFQLPSSKA
jgi:two-component system KDP operon response regulator KdpE